MRTILHERAKILKKSLSGLVLDRNPVYLLEDQAYNVPEMVLALPPDRINLMESDIGTRSTLVLMTGLPGSGKTTLACELHKRYNWVVVEKDGYRNVVIDILRERGIRLEEDEEKNADLIGWLAHEISFAVIRKLLFNSTLISEEDSRIILQQKLNADIAATIAHEISFVIQSQVPLNQGKPAFIILDAAVLHSSLLEQAQKIMREVKNGQLKVILCVTDYDLRQSRLNKRSAEAKEKTRIRLNPENIRDYLNCFKHLPKSKLKLNTANSLEECLRRAEEYLLS